MDAFTAETAFPPSLVGQPVLAMLVTMGFWFGTLLCLQWIYSLTEDLVKNPRPRRHPLTATRVVKLALLFAALSQTVPRLAMLMAWKIMDAEARIAWAVSSWVIYIPWALMFAFAWWVDRQARAAEAVQMSRPYAPQVPLEKGSMTASQKKRGASIFVMIFVIAFATTYIRPAASDGPPAIIDQRH